MAKLIIAIVVIFALLALMPIATIWSLNTLFPVLAIPVSFDTWLATIILSGVVGGGLFTATKK
jgi:hypothetical protein